MEMIDIIERLNYLKEEENKVTGEVKELLERFDNTLKQKEKERLGLEDEISKLGGNKNETKENLRAVTKNILIYKVNLDRIKDRLDELDKKSISIKKDYEELLSRPMSNIFTIEPDIGSVEMVELSKTKKGLITAMDNIFGKYESEIEEIENEKKRLKGIEETIIKKDEEAKRQEEILTNSLKAYSDEITKYKNELRSSIIEEMRIIEEFNRVVKNIDRAVIVSDEVKGIINKVSAAI
jgi:septal ring factor EnvC (AmiA/AmiB activator)